MSFAWLYCTSDRRGSKYHLFRDTEPRSVCGHARRKKAQGEIRGEQVSPACIHCRSLARKQGVA